MKKLKYYLLFSFVLNIFFVIYIYQNINLTSVDKENRNIEVKNKILEKKDNVKILTDNCDIMISSLFFLDNKAFFNDYSTKECIKFLEKNNFWINYLFEEDILKLFLKNLNYIKSENLIYYKNIFKSRFYIDNYNLNNIDYNKINLLLNVIDDKKFVEDILNKSLNWFNSNLFSTYLNFYLKYKDIKNINNFLKEAKEKWIITEIKYKRFLKILENIN